MLAFVVHKCGFIHASGAAVRFFSGIAIWSCCVAASEREETAREFQLRLLEACENRRAMCVEYSLKNELTANQSSSGYISRIVAADRSGHFVLDNGHAHGAMSRVDDPYRKVTHIAHSNVTVFRPMDRIIERFDLADIDMSLNLPHELVAVLGWWPFPSRPEPEIHGRNLSIAACMNEHFTLRREAEYIGTNKCRVIEISMRDVIWIDMTIGNVIRRRELCDLSTGAVALRITFDQFLQCTPDVVVPTQIIFEEFDSASPIAAARTRRVGLLVVCISSIQCNEELDLSSMNITPLPGTIEMDAGNECHLVAAGEDDHAESLIRWSRSLLQPKAKEFVRPPWTRLAFGLLYVLAGFIAGVVLQTVGKIDCDWVDLLLSKVRFVLINQAWRR